MFLIYPCSIKSHLMLRWFRESSELVYCSLTVKLQKRKVNSHFLQNTILAASGSEKRHTKSPLNKVKRIGYQFTQTLVIAMCLPFLLQKMI